MPSAHDTTATTRRECALDGESALKLAEAARELEVLVPRPASDLGAHEAFL